MVVGILALQGAFAEHEHMLDMLDVEHFEIRQKRDLEKKFDALVLPGGESTVIGKLMIESELLEPIRKCIESGMPVMGTCAGLILLAKEVEANRTYLGTMDIQVKRNAYGRQLGSFCTKQEVKGLGEVPMVFIRAPYIMSVGENVEILAVVDGRIVAARQGKQLAVAFHPELTEDVRVYRYFLNMIEKS